MVVNCGLKFKGIALCSALTAGGHFMQIRVANHNSISLKGDKWGAKPNRILDNKNGRCGTDRGRKVCGFGYPHYRVCNQWLMDEQAPQINLIEPDRRKESYLCTHISTELYLWLANSGLHSNLNTYPHTVEMEWPENELSHSRRNFKNGILIHMRTHPSAPWRRSGRISFRHNKDRRL